VFRLPRIALVSPVHFLRIFCATIDGMPHCYPQRRRAERAMFLLCESDRSVADLCFEVGSGSPGAFSRPFEIAGRSPRDYRKQAVAADVPTCSRWHGCG
jgi:transcriptional regulator GlxA family with amidase domain